MDISGDTRGVSEVLGAILVFGLVLSLLVLVQTLAVPAANEQVEFDHNQRAHDDFLDLQQGVDVTAARASSQTANVEAGVRYPNRFFLLNPAPASGNVRTEASYFAIENATAVDSETAEFWQGNAKNYSSNVVRYRANYNNYGNAPTTNYEHGLAYNNHPNGKTTLLGTGSVVDGKRVTLLAVDGNLSTTTSSTIALETEPLSAPTQAVSVKDDSDGPVTLHLRTDMTNETWTDLLADERYVESWDHDGGEITIVLEENEIYDVRMAEVGVGSGYTDEDPAYIASEGVSPRFVELGGNKLAVEVRDRYNTGESGVDVTFELEDGEGDFIDDQGNAVPGDTITVTADEDGRAETVFKPSDGPVTISAKSEFDGESGYSDNETVLFEDIAVVSGGGGDGGASGEINPYSDDALIQESAVLNDATAVAQTDYINVTFQNNADSTKSVNETRINAYIIGSISSRDEIKPTNATMNGSLHEVAGPYVSDHSDGYSFKKDISADEKVTYVFTFKESDGSNFELDEGDFFVFSIKFSDGSTARYFIIPDDSGLN